MHLLITGGSGFIGTHLVDRLIDAGHQVTLLSRTKKEHSDPRITWITWEQLKTSAGRTLLQDIETVIHLAGYSIANRWTKKNTHLMHTSRIDTIYQVMQAVSEKCHSVISASATGRFPSSNELYTERSLLSNSPENFLEKLCTEWEQAVYRAAGNKRRVVIARFGNVLGDAGLLASFETFRHIHTTVGFGSGDNWFSWIHIADIARLLHRLVEDEHTRGIYHATSPHPVRWNLFLEKLKKVWHIRFHVQLPAWTAKLVLGDQSVLLLGSWKVTSIRLPAIGFSYIHETIDSALGDLSDSK